MVLHMPIKPDPDDRDPLDVAGAEAFGGNDNDDGVSTQELPVGGTPRDAREAGLALAQMGGTAPEARRNKRSAWDRYGDAAAPRVCTQGFADLAGSFDYDDAYDYRAVRARGRVRGDDAADPGPTAAEVANALQTVAHNDGVPAHRRRLVAGLVDAVRDGQLHGGDTAGDDAHRER